MALDFYYSWNQANLMNQLAVSCGVSWALCARAGLGKQRASFACALCGASAHTVTKRNERGRNADRLNAIDMPKANLTRLNKKHVIRRHGETKTEEPIVGYMQSGPSEVIAFHSGV